MKKDVKVIEIKSITANSNDRTVYVIGSLDLTVTDVCQSEDIPVLSIISTHETLPMSQAKAQEYIFCQHMAHVLDPNISFVKVTIRSCIA